MKTNFLMSIYDFFWVVVQSFLRGKFGDKSYQIKKGIFRLPKGTTSKRVVMLMRWGGGFKPATIKELYEQLEIENKKKDQDKQIPWLYWENDKWSIVNKDVGWRDSQKFFTKK